MGSFSNYLENKLLDHILNATSLTAPTTVYIAWCTATVADTDTGSTITEPVGNNYSRTAVTCNTTNFPAAASGAISNGTAITSATASGSWGTITDIAICDAATLGNILAYDALATSKAVGANDKIELAVGDLDLTLD